MKKRELMGVVSKVMGFYLVVIGSMQFVNMIPMLLDAFKTIDAKFVDYYFFIGYIAAMVAYYLIICWCLIAKAEKISSFLIKDSENSVINIGIGKEGVQQILFYAAGVYLMLDIVILIVSALSLIGISKYGLDLASRNILQAVVKVLVGAALIIFCRPISRFTDKLSERFK